jgi:hypothetical protein
MNTVQGNVTGRAPFNKSNEIAPLVVSPRQAMQLLNCGKTRLFELLAAGELESYLDGKSRKIVFDSITARHRRKLQENKAA